VELLLENDRLNQVRILRRFLDDIGGAVEQMEFLRGKMRNTKDNEEFLQSMRS
jgi:transcription termination factor Rho